MDEAGFSRVSSFNPYWDTPGALHLPHRLINTKSLEKWPRETLFVVYCAGSHCNGADRAALKLAQLGRKVKIMIGGIKGWEDEGLAFATT